HRRRPQVFMGAAYALWDFPRLESLARSRPGASDYEMWLGRPVSVEDTPARLKVRPDTSQLVALVGSDQGRDRLVPHVISSIIVSMSHQLPLGSEIVILDSAGDNTLERIDAALSHAARLGMVIRVVTS